MQFLAKFWASTANIKGTAALQTLRQSQHESNTFQLTSQSQNDPHPWPAVYYNALGLFQYRKKRVIERSRDVNLFYGTYSVYSITLSISLTSQLPCWRYTCQISKLSDRFVVQSRIFETYGKASYARLKRASPWCHREIHALLWHGTCTPKTAHWTSKI